MPANRRPGERACDRLSADGSPSAGVAERPRIFILSDVRLYREGIAVTLGQTNSVDVLGAGAPPDAFARVAQLLPDVVVLDSSLDDALSLPRRMREVVPGVKIVAFAVSGVAITRCPGCCSPPQITHRPRARKSDDSTTFVNIGWMDVKMNQPCSLSWLGWGR